MTELLEITLKRFSYSPKSTIGSLTIGASKWFTLEDAVRLVKVPKVTAIPAGRYKVVPWVFGLVNQIRPMLVGVPDYTGVFMHVGNKPDDTEGCILPGKSKSDDVLFQSTIAYTEIAYPLCEAWGALREVWIRIVDEEGHPWFD